VPNSCAASWTLWRNSEVSCDSNRHSDSECGSPIPQPIEGWKTAERGLSSVVRGAAQSHYKSVERFEACEIAGEEM